MVVRAKEKKNRGEEAGRASGVEESGILEPVRKGPQGAGGWSSGIGEDR